MKKMKIEDLRLKSFVTKLDGKITKGGAPQDTDIEKCSAIDACPSALQCLNSD